MILAHKCYQLGEFGICGKIVVLMITFAKIIVLILVGSCNNPYDFHAKKVKAFVFLHCDGYDCFCSCSELAASYLTWVATLRQGGHGKVQTGRLASYLAFTSTGGVPPVHAEVVCRG